MRILQYIFLLICCCCCSRTITAIPADTHDNCAEWADMGECEVNPNYMHINCATSCDRVEKANEQDLQGVSSFYDLAANDIKGNLVNFADFREKLVILTNVASYCGYTESHYRGLVDLWSYAKNLPVEILAFPCNQFGEQEPGSAQDIIDFAASKGVEFTMMQKINVNGGSADKVYKYLKKAAGGPKNIQWNFSTYFVVNPNDGSVKAYSGVEPMGLQPVIEELLGREEL